MSLTLRSLMYHCACIVWINCSSDLKIFANSQPSASNFKSFSRSLEHFFLTVGQNNFSNKIQFQTSYYELHIDRFCLLLSKNYELVITWNLYEVHEKLLNQLVFIVSLNDPNMHTEWYLSVPEQKYAYYFLTKFTILAIVLWAVQPKAQCKGPYFNYVSTFLSIFDQLLYTSE